jgi:hypothetical protein
MATLRSKLFFFFEKEKEKFDQKKKKGIILYLSMKSQPRQAARISGIARTGLAFSSPEDKCRCESLNKPNRKLSPKQNRVHQ